MFTTEAALALAAAWLGLTPDGRWLAVGALEPKFWTQTTPRSRSLK